MTCMVHPRWRPLPLSVSVPTGDHFETVRGGDGVRKGKEEEKGSGPICAAAPFNQ